MPVRVGRACTRQGCAGIVTDGVCSVCGPTKRRTDAQYDQQRGSARERGYTWQWEKVRAMHLRNEPFCRRCNSTGGGDDGGLLVDHIVPIADGGAVLDDNNLQTLCVRCHAVKTQEDLARRENKVTWAGI